MNKEEILKQACHFVSVGWPLDQDQVLRLYQQVEVAKNNIAPDEYKIGVETMAKVFKPNGLTNISDLQAVFDAVEVALLQTNGVQGLERAAQFIDKRASDYVQEHGVTDPETGAVEFPGWGDEYVSELEELAEAIRSLSHPVSPAMGVERPVEGGVFQDCVKPWMVACFGEEISNDKLERCDRFIEEALELVQAIGYSADRAHALVDYVFNRDIGEPQQEVGGVMVTLAALCLASGLDMNKAGEDELARIWTKVEKIRAKQAAKPTGSALPIARPQAPGVAV